MSLRIFGPKVPAVGTSILLHVAACSAMWLASGSTQVPETAISAQLVADVQPGADKQPPASDAEPQFEPPRPTRYAVKSPPAAPSAPVRTAAPPAPVRAAALSTPVRTAAPIQRSSPVEAPLPIETPTPIETPPPIEAPMPKADHKPVAVAKADPAPAPVTRNPVGATAVAAPTSNAPAGAGPAAPADARVATAASDGLPMRSAPPSAGTSRAIVAALPAEASTQTATPRGGYQLRPTYPSSARRAGSQGTTVLGVFVGADGRVADVVVKQSAGHPDLDRAATEAVRRWRFEPARRGGEAVAMWVELPVEFQLR